MPEGTRRRSRSGADAPAIDGSVFIEDGGGLKAGEFVEVIVQRAGERDLWAQLVA